MRPLGVCHLKGKLGAFASFPEVIFPGGKPSTELASESLKPCLTFAKEKGWLNGMEMDLYTF
jgi:hypothetical protein